MYQKPKEEFLKREAHYLKELRLRLSIDNIEVVSRLTINDIDPLALPMYHQFCAITIIDENTYAVSFNLPVQDMSLLNTSYFDQKADAIKKRFKAIRTS